MFKNLKKDFIVERHGKSFVLYAGLLDLAHQNGLKEVRTELVQVPTQDNHSVAICFATVVLESDGTTKTRKIYEDTVPHFASTYEIGKRSMNIQKCRNKSGFLL